MSELILASASPRRREILALLGLEFDVAPSDVDERALDEVQDHETLVRAAALSKLEHALARNDRLGAHILAADTMVFVEDHRLGKPDDDADALRMLRLLAGRDHAVRTATALGRVGEGVLECRVSETRVWFRDASDDELRRYVATSESRDKAGAYGIQGLAAGFVTRIEGSYTNVVGLPAAEVIDMLCAHGALESWP